MSEQQQEFNRVKSKIADAILGFFKHEGEGSEFHADELRKWVENSTGKTAPGSADRILRDLRKSNQLNYKVTNRRQSLYKIIPIQSEKLEQIPLL